MSELKTYDVIMTPSDDGSWVLKSAADREIRHQKYKRCLAMAKLCHWKMGVFIYKKEKSNFYYRWHKRWLELAEKFKPDNSTAQ